MPDFSNHTITSRVEAILDSMLNDTEYDIDPDSVVEYLLIELNEQIKRLSKALKPAGNKLFSELGVPSIETVGYIYNITEDFTTNQYFIDGAGETFPSGTGVYGIVYRDPSTGEETYWWDVLGSIMDLSDYVTKSMIGAPNGVAPLNENGELDFENAGLEPVTALDLEAMWDGE